MCANSQHIPPPPPPPPPPPNTQVLRSLLFQYSNEENELSQDAFIILAIKLKTLFDAFDTHSKEGILTVNLGAFISIGAKI